jgi:putative membrane protein
VSPARLLRAALVLLADALALLLLSAPLPGFHPDRPAAALSTAVVVGALNAVVWPLLARFALPLSVMTLGLAALVLNGALVAFAIDIVPGAGIDDVGTAIGVVLGLTVLTTLSPPSLRSMRTSRGTAMWFVARRGARAAASRATCPV